MVPEEDTPKRTPLTTSPFVRMSDVRLLESLQRSKQTGLLNAGHMLLAGRVACAGRHAPLARYGYAACPCVPIARPHGDHLATARVGSRLTSPSLLAVLLLGPLRLNRV